MLEGEGWFTNRPCGGLVARSHVTGDHKGRPYGKGGRSGMMFEGRAVHEPPLRGVGRTVACNGRAQGTPLREEGTERHDVGGGKAVPEPPLRGVGRTVACNGRPQGTSLREEGMERHDVGGGKAVPEPPLRGVVARSHVTGDHEGRPYGKGGRSGMTWEGEGWFPNRSYGGWPHGRM